MRGHEPADDVTNKGMIQLYEQDECCDVCGCLVCYKSPAVTTQCTAATICWTCTTFCVVSYGDRGSLTRSRRMQFFRGKRCNCGPLRHTDVFWIHYAAHISKYLQIGFTPELPQLIYAYILYTAIQYVNGATFS